MSFLERYFGIEQAGSTVGREVVGGLTTFATMSYIIFVQPAVLSACGMPFGSVLVATCLSAAAGCLLMGLLARLPFALAPGMGENFLFAFTVCSTFPGGMGFNWPAGLTIVLISGLLFVLVTATGAREKVLHVLPPSLQHAIGPAIGLFIAFIGLQWGGIVVQSQGTMVTLVTSSTYSREPALLTLLGLILIVVLMARGFRGAILVGVIATAVLGLLTGTLQRPDTAFSLSAETFFRLNISELAAQWDKALIAIALFLFLDFFDTVGTLAGVGRQAGLIGEDGRLPRARQAFFSDALASCIGALFGTSTVTTYIESATGVAAGARTGLAAVVAGVCFLGAIALAPVAWIVGNDAGPAFYGVLPTDLHVAMHPAVAPALIVVGFLMMAPLRHVAWDDVTESVPAFLTMVIMVFGYGIIEGVAAGCIAHPCVKLLAGRGREVHPVMYIVGIALVLRYVFLS